MAMSENEKNQRAYKRLKGTVAKQFPRGHFVAIAGGKVIADAPSLEKLRALLEEEGRNSTRVLVVEAGVDYPDYVTIFLV